MPRRELFLLILFRVSRSIAAGMVYLAFPYLILTRLHYSPLMLGFLYTAGAIATAALGLVFGVLTDVWGRKPTLITVAATLPLSSAIIYFSHGLPMLFFGAMLGGYSATGSLMGGGVGGAAAPIQNAVVADLTPVARRTGYFSFFTFVSGFFAAVGTLVGKLFEVRAAFLCATWIAAAGLVLLPAMRLHRHRGEIRRLASKKTIGQFSLTGLLNGFSQGLINPFLIPFFVIVFHLPKSQMAVWGFAAGAIGAVALLFAPALDRRLGFVRTVGITRGIGAAFLLAMPFVHHLWAALAIYLATPALRVVSIPVQQSALAEMVDASELGRALGVNQVARLAASSGGVAFTGYLFDISDIAAPFVLYAAVMAGNIALYVRFFSAQERALRAARPAE